MKRILLGMVAAAALSSAAAAADLPVLPLKAPAVTPTSLWSTGGWYLGLESGAAVANASVSGNNSLFLNGFTSGNLHADGGYIGGAFGYMRGNPASWYGFDCDAAYRNITAGVSTATQSIGVASRWSAGCGGRFGGSVDPLTLLANATNAIGLGSLSFPTFNPVPPPGAHVAAAPRTYAELGAEAFGISGDFGVTGGAEVVVAPRIKVGALWQQLDSTGKPTGGVFDVDAKIVFANKGLQINNVFDPNTGVTFSGQASMGNVYAVELRYLFAPGGISISK